MGGPASTLQSVEPAIGDAQEPLDILAIVRPGGHPPGEADAGAAPCPVRDHDRVSPQAVEDFRRLCGSGLREEQDELIAAETGGGVRLAQNLEQRVCDADERLIPTAYTSLTALNSSRSNSAMQNSEPARRDRTISASRRSRNARRFIRPVSESVRRSL
jgi:hypothetical protein